MHRIVVLVVEIQVDVHGVMGVVLGSCGTVAGMVHVFGVTVTRRAGDQIEKWEGIHVGMIIQLALRVNGWK